MPTPSQDKRGSELDQVRALAAAAMSEILLLKSMLGDSAGDAGTEGAGLVADVVADDYEKPVLSLVRFTRDGSNNVTGVVLRGSSIGARVISHCCSIAGTSINHERFALAPSTPAQNADNDYELSLTNNATNWIYAQIGGIGSTWDILQTTGATEPGPATAADTNTYVTLARIVVAAGKVTAVDWQHVGDIQFYSWDLGAVVKSVDFGAQSTENTTASFGTNFIADQT